MARQLLYSILVTTIISCGVTRKSEEHIHSTAINDFYKVVVLETNPKGDFTKSIIVLDAGVDRRVEKLYETLQNRDNDTNYRVIGLAHSKFSNTVRRRDFIPAAEDSFFCSKAKYLGQANLFKDFLVNEFLPQYDADTDLRILIGHSFGGMFAAYVSLTDSTTFHRIIALSPSFWLNYRSFITHYRADTSLAFKTPVSMAYGSLEKLNFIGGSIEEFEKYMRPQDQQKITIQVKKGRTHMGILKDIHSFL